MAPVQNNSSESVHVVRHKVDSLKLYDVKEEELEILEKGSPESLLLSIAIALISSAFSIFVSMPPFEAMLKNLILLFLMIAFSVVGIVLLIVWFSQNKSTTNIIKRIKSRRPDDEPDDNEQEKSSNQDANMANK